MKLKDIHKSFSSDSELFKYLRENKTQLIEEKKSQILKSCEKGLGVKVKFLDVDKLESVTKDLDIDKEHYYIAVNTTKILDSHRDLHVNGIWNKTVKERQGQNYLVLDHELKASQTVVKKEHIEMFTVELPFSALGKSYEGNTEALIYKFRKDKVINSTAKEWLESGDDIEASVRMQYVKIELAIDSNLKEDKAEKAVYDKFISHVANKEDFEEIKYFFVVKEAKNVSVSSLVLFGSNSATGQLQENKIKEIKQNINTQLEELKMQFKSTNDEQIITKLNDLKEKLKGISQEPFSTHNEPQNVNTPKQKPLLSLLGKKSKN